MFSFFFLSLISSRAINYRNQIKISTPEIKQLATSLIQTATGSNPSVGVAYGANPAGANTAAMTLSTLQSFTPAGSWPSVAAALGVTGVTTAPTPIMWNGVNVTNSTLTWGQLGLANWDSIIFMGIPNSPIMLCVSMNGGATSTWNFMTPNSFSGETLGGLWTQICNGWGLPCTFPSVAIANGITVSTQQSASLASLGVSYGSFVTFGITSVSNPVALLAAAAPSTQNFGNVIIQYNNKTFAYVPTMSSTPQGVWAAWSVTQNLLTTPAPNQILWNGQDVTASTSTLTTLGVKGGDVLYFANNFVSVVYNGGNLTTLYPVMSNTPAQAWAQWATANNISPSPVPQPIMWDGKDVTGSTQTLTQLGVKGGDAFVFGTYGIFSPSPPSTVFGFVFVLFNNNVYGWQPTLTNTPMQAWTTFATSQNLPASPAPLHVYINGVDQTSSTSSLSTLGVTAASTIIFGNYGQFSTNGLY